MTTYSGILTNVDGSSLSISITYNPGIVPVIPSSGPIPTNPAPTTVVIGKSSFTLAAVNPTSTAFPGGRGTNQLVAYQYPLDITATNMWGVEVAVSSANVVTAVNNRETSSSTTGTTIPTDGYVLSGHGTAYTWLLQYATVGATVSFTSTPVTPVTTTATMAVYYQLGVDQVSQIPASCNQLRLAFGTGDPPSLTGASPSLTAFRTAGGKVLLTLGGEGGQITQSDHAGIVAAVQSIATSVGGLDGIDWDLEAVGMSVSDVVAISESLATIYGTNWITSFVPPGGSPVAPAIQAAAQLAKAGHSVQWSQQFYGASVDAQQAITQCNLAISGGVPAGSVLVGIMIGSDSNTWTVATATSNMQAIKSAIPNIGGASWWHAGISGTAQSVAAVAALF